MTTRRTLLKSLSLAPVALLAPKVALGLSQGPKLVERPWDALVGLTLNYISLEKERALLKSTCGRTFQVKHLGNMVPSTSTFPLDVVHAEANKGRWCIGTMWDTSRPLRERRGYWVNTQVAPTLYEIC